MRTVLLFIALLLAELCHAQVSSIYGSLRISVVDATGSSVPGSSIEVTTVERNWRRLIEGSDSAYLPALMPSDYKVVARAEGFEPATASVRVLLGHETALRLVLQPLTRREVIAVTAQAEVVDSYTIPVQTHISNQEIQGLPVNQRNFLDFALLDAGVQRDTLRVHAAAVTSGFNVLGQRPRSNSLQMDGADLNDESTGGVRGSVPMEAVQEFQVLTSGYQAEYGRASGGLVNVITKSGTNEIHGTLFGFLRHRSLDATNAFSSIKDPPYTRTQYGGSLGGPLRKGRTWYFLSLEQLRRQESGFSRVGLNPGVFALTQQQESLAASQPNHPAVVAAIRGSAIARTGVDPATGAPPPYRITPLENLGGVYPVSERMGAYMARLDHEISVAHRLSARLNYAHDKLSAFEPQNNDQISGLIAFERTAALTTLDPTIVVTLNSSLRPSILNDFRFSAAQRKFDMSPNGLGAPVNIAGVAFLGRENILPHYRKEKHFHLGNVITASARTHILKFGGDLMLCPTTIEYHSLINGLFVFGSQPAPGAPPGAPLLTPVQSYGLGLPGSFAQRFGNPTAESGKRSVGLFVQDSWRMYSGLTLDLGLRYDIESASPRNADAEQMESIYRQLSLRRAPPTDTNNLQPRFGFAWQPRRGGGLTVRGAYGIYYDRLLNLATWVAAANDGVQMTRLTLLGGGAAAVFRSPAQKLTAFPADAAPTGIVVFSQGWQLGNSQQGNIIVSQAIRQGLALEAGYVWVRGTHLPRARDVNPPDSARAAAFLAAGNPMPALLRQNFFRPVAEVSEALAFEGSAASTYHGLRVALRGTLAANFRLNASYTFSKAIDDGDEVFPHSRAQDMRNFRAERGLALFDQRQRFVAAAIYRTSGLSGGARRYWNDWSVAPYLELGSGRPVNVLLGSDNNLDQDPVADRPNLVPAGTPGAFATRFGWFAVPPLGQPGNLGRNAFVGPGYASFNLRLQRELAVREMVSLQVIAEVFNILNRTNVRAVNPNFQRAGEPLAAFDPRQIQFAMRLRF